MQHPCFIALDFIQNPKKEKKFTKRLMWIEQTARLKTTIISSNLFVLLRNIELNHDQMLISNNQNYGLFIANF